MRDKSTNIAANLHCLCWSFIWPPGWQFHYASWEISSFRKWSKSRMHPTYHQSPANNIG